MERVEEEERMKEEEEKGDPPPLIKCSSLFYRPLGAQPIDARKGDEMPSSNVGKMRRGGFPLSKNAE